jgi:acyl carrier protein
MEAAPYEFLLKAFKEMNYDVDDVTRETPLGPAGMDLESIAVAEIAIQIEDTFGVRFGEEEAERLALMSIGDLADEIAKRVAEADA